MIQAKCAGAGRITEEEELFYEAAGAARMGRASMRSELSEILIKVVEISQTAQQTPGHSTSGRAAPACAPSVVSFSPTSLNSWINQKTPRNSKLCWGVPAHAPSSLRRPHASGFCGDLGYSEIDMGAVLQPAAVSQPPCLWVVAAEQFEGVQGTCNSVHLCTTSLPPA